MNETTQNQSGTIVLALALDQIRRVQTAYQDAGDGKGSPGVAVSLNATTAALSRAIAALSEAIVASVGYVTPPTKGPK